MNRNIEKKTELSKNQTEQIFHIIVNKLVVNFYKVLSALKLKCSSCLFENFNILWNNKKNIQGSEMKIKMYYKKYSWNFNIRKRLMWNANINGQRNFCTHSYYWK